MDPVRLQRCILLALLAILSTRHDVTGAEAEPAAAATSKPHIIVIMADDLGFNDVSFHGSDQIPTPNIDALAAFGIALNRHYVAPMCTPSRAALMSGRYQSHVGMHHFVITSEQPFGLGLGERLIPEHLRAAGYRTHAVGKWHLGYYMRRYTPTRRGFDSHYGYLGPYIDYYDHSLVRENDSLSFACGHDMRRNLTVAHDDRGRYATDLFTDVAVDTIAQHPKHLPLFLYLAHLAPHAGNEADPLQVPADELAKFAHIRDVRRRHYAAMVSRVDAGVGRVVEALRANGMLENSVVLFFADNGAPVRGLHANTGSNLPFRGQKESPWEGAVRSASAIWSPLLDRRQRVSDQLVHITDWLPTFAHLAGVPLNGSTPTDGHNVWPALAGATPSPRTEALCNLDPIDGYASLVRGDWKLVNGTSYGGRYDGWVSAEEQKLAANDTGEQPAFAYGQAVVDSLAGRALRPFALPQAPVGPTQVEAMRADATIGCLGVPEPTDEDGDHSRCRPLEAPCLFNVVEDPCERRNLANVRPDVLLDMRQRLAEFVRSAAEPRNRPGDERANPAQFNGTWTWWYDELGLPDHSGAGSRATVATTVGLVVAVVVAWGGFA